MLLPKQVREQRLRNGKIQVNALAIERYQVSLSLISSIELSSAEESCGDRQIEQLLAFINRHFRLFEFAIDNYSQSSSCPQASTSPSPRKKFPSPPLLYCLSSLLVLPDSCSSSPNSPVFFVSNTPNCPNLCATLSAPVRVPLKFKASGPSYSHKLIFVSWEREGEREREAKLTSSIE